MPVGGICHKSRSEILSFEQIYKIVKAACGLGIEKVRLTGGEPLLRKDISLLIKSLKSIDGLKEISLTTNGVYLREQVALLKRSGLERINISLDSLIPENFRKITRGGNLMTVLKGIESALSAGFSLLKINTVLLKGFNIDEVLSFVNLAKSQPIHVRFIEYMPTDFDYFSYDDLYFSGQEAKKICESVWQLNPVNDNRTPGTAKVFQIDGFCGTVGFISSISEPFCSSCNKLRLTSCGSLRSCLHSSETVDLKEAMEKQAGYQELSALIKKAAELKPHAHNLLNVPSNVNSENFSMCQIGG